MILIVVIAKTINRLLTDTVMIEHKKHKFGYKNIKCAVFGERGLNVYFQTPRWLTTRKNGHSDICLNCRLGSACTVRAS